MEAGDLETPTEAEEDKGSREPRPSLPFVLCHFEMFPGGAFIPSPSDILSLTPDSQTGFGGRQPRTHIQLVGPERLA